MKGHELVRVTVNADGFQPYEIEEVLRLLENHAFRLNATIDSSFQETNPKSSMPSLDWNALIITLAASGGVLTSLISILSAKAGRDKSITIEIDGDKITLTGATTEHQKILIDEWIKRHQKTRKRN